MGISLSGYLGITFIGMLILVIIWGFFYIEVIKERSDKLQRRIDKHVCPKCGCSIIFHGNEGGATALRSK